MSEFAVAEDGSASYSRVVVAALFSLIVGAVAIAAIQIGVAGDYLAEDPRHTWGAFLWGDHPVLRVVASVLATLTASWIAGVAGRSAGGAAALLGSIPSVLGWAYLSVIAFTGSLSIFGQSTQVDITRGNKLAALILVAITLAIALRTGRAGGKTGEALAPHFDSRRRSLFGVAWFHWFWIAPLLYTLFILNSWAVFYFLSLQVALWNLPVLQQIVPGLLSIGTLATLYMTGQGIQKAYRILARLETHPAPARAVIVHGLGYPAAAVLIQTALNLTHRGIEHILG